ncbi:2-succinyl-5-enolpyruvyl-6-hydroxy-3-cyclohexene-1-carboxylic-acid synthase [Bacillus timonensis]|nr:2-succinyl-5-enolpyruvyl-6-hydroxy-3-cyclohexene-1-carboxylic-acid synthase [Bacillus timonensis]
MNANDAITAYVASFVDELVSVGVSDVVISPGSRSTPMALLMAAHPQMNEYINIDERSAAFFALGMAKAKRKPVAILCTSGTAAANYYPAIVEAHISRVPLIVLTADRPHELRDVGAPQAIDQIHLFGGYVKWFAEMALPEKSETMLNYVRTVAGRAAGKAIAAPSGPVHLNFPFREPLVPNLEGENLWRKNERTTNKSFVNVTAGKPTIDEETIEEIYSSIATAKKGIIICGEHNHVGFSDAVIQLAEKLQFPIIADPLSQLRSGAHSKEVVIDSYDAFLRNQEFCSSYQPDVIIRFGAMPISKALLLYVKNLSCPQIVVDGDGGWREPTLTASEMIYCDEIDFCTKLTKTANQNTEKKWIQAWQGVNNLSKDYLMHKEEISENLFEGDVFNSLLSLLPNKATLFVGNSMPIRDLDTFFFNNDKDITVLANRGANGIDGIVSTALGASTALDHPLVLVIGDLSFYHDLNGLLAAKLHKLNITIILINNDGGGIFSFLPQAKEEKHFESLFGTPLGLNYEYAVRMYGGSYSQVESWMEFNEKMTESLSETGLSVVEIVTNREENVVLHKKMWNRVSQEITNKLLEGKQNVHSDD